MQKANNTQNLGEWKHRWHSSDLAKVGIVICVHVRESNKSITEKHAAVVQARTLVLKGSYNLSPGKCQKFGVGT